MTMTTIKTSIILLFLVRFCSAQLDPALAAQTTLTNDTFAASSFYNDVPHLDPVRDDETLSFTGDGEIVFGYARACTSQGYCRSVFVRPLDQITRHWLVVLQADWQRLQEVWPTTTKERAQYIAEYKAQMEKPDAVWTKLTKLYCQLQPHAKYKDLDGIVVVCSSAPGN